jgi:putative FmdB family regulatory protein
MPLYEFNCRDCGTFTKVRSVAECSRPAECPVCGGLAQKIFSIVNLRSMSSGNRRAWERNEQSAHAPHVCGSGCSHQRGVTPKKPARPKLRFLGSRKANSRPWMLGH